MSSPGPLARTLHVSVPEHESRWAKQFLEDAVWTKRPLDNDLAREHPDVRVLSVSSQDTVDLQQLKAFASLEAVVTRSTGCDRLPLEGMRELGVRAYHLNGYATQSVAQHTLMSILMLLHRVPEASRMTAGLDGRGASPVWDRSGLAGRNLHDVTVGVLGTGRIGSRVVRLLSGMGAHVVGYDVAPDRELEQVEGFRYAGSFVELLADSEALTIHVPLDEGTRGMLDAGALDRLSSGAVLVNTARGAIINQGEVAKRLRDGRLAGYAADVLPGEPDPPELALFSDLPTAVLTPHLAAYDSAALAARYDVTAQVCRRVLAGDEAPLRKHLATSESAR